MFGFGLSSMDKMILGQAEKMLSPYSAMGLDVRPTVKRLFNEAKEEIRKQRGEFYSTDFGDRLLRSDAAYIPRRAAGLTDKDIRGYWNRPILLVLLDEKIRNFIEFMTLAISKQQGKDLTLAAQETRRKSPVFGDPAGWNPASAGLSPDDANIYPEFLYRVADWMQRTPAHEIERQLAPHKTFNAMIRSLVRDGKL
ncbi:MAG TPA: hypothetical protein VKS60_05360 [Stellaceae bacterium]|nr:hypothetical protein [Stellaceae bacterium]